MSRLPIGTRLNNYGVRAVVIGNAVDYLLAYEGAHGTTTSEDPLAEGWAIVESDADREVEALRRQVADLAAERDSLQAACICAGCGTREGTCDEDGLCDGCGCDVIVGSIGAVKAVERLRGERESYDARAADLACELRIRVAEREDALRKASELRSRLARLGAA